MHGVHHYRKRKKKPSKEFLKIKKTYDKLIYIIVMICPLMNLPQLYNVWIEKNVSGVSAVSWFGFSIISVTWLVYGILHRDNHIIILNASLIVVQSLVGFGVVLYG